MAYRIGSILVQPEQPDFASVLAEAYRARVRPLCLCKGEPGLPMYIACINGHYYLKRMPNTGQEHAVHCVSWEMPEELSGRAELGSGIRVDGDAVLLKLAFPLAKQGNRPAPEAKDAASNEKLSVNNGGKRLSLQGLLHMLWDEAALNKWNASDSWRSWESVYTALNIAIDGKVVKHHPLSKYVYLPEPWQQDKAEERAARRRKKFAEFTAEQGKGHPLMLLIGEWKKLEDAALGGSRAIIKHVPGFAFQVNDQLRKRVEKYYAQELALVKATEDQKTHLVVAATFSVTAAGTAEFEELTLMPVTPQWIPFDNIYELDLLRHLTEQKRSFLRPLRYNRVKEGIYMPTAILTDTGEPTALFVVPPERELDKYEHGTLELDLKKWFWDTRASELLPVIPAKAA